MFIEEDSFSALKSTHLISDIPYFTSKFVLMLVVIVLSLDDWRRRWMVFHSSEEDPNNWLIENKCFPLYRRF